MSAVDFPVMTICGSMRYYNQMLQAAQEYTANGWIVLMPFVSYNNGQKIPGDDFADMLTNMHIAKMAMSETIVVIGPHRGESTLAEMEWAKEHGLKIIEDHIYRGGNPNVL